jgi:hypothetical protein
MKKIFFTVTLILVGGVFYLLRTHRNLAKPIEWDNSKMNELPQIQKFNTTDFSQYLKTEHFNFELIMANSTDLEKAFFIMNWAHTRWSHRGDNDPHTMDPKIILEKAKKGEQFRCVEYAVITAAMAQTIGLQARVVGIRRADVETAFSSAGHVIAEIFLADKNKWIMVDPQWARIPIIKNEPIGTTEFAKALGQKEVQFLTDENVIKYDSTYYDWITPYLYYISFRIDQRYGFNSENRDQIILIPKGAKIPEKFQRMPIKGKVFPAFSTIELYGKKI